MEIRTSDEMPELSICGTPVEHDHYFARAVLQDGLQRHSELLAGIADGEAAMNVEDMNTAVFAHVDFDGSVEGHGIGPGTIEQHPRRKALYDDAAGKHVNEMEEVA